MLILLNLTHKWYFCDNDAIYDVIIQVPVENDVITTDIKSAGIHSLTNHSLRPSQSFSFSDKSTGPYLPFVVLVLLHVNSKCSTYNYMYSDRVITS